MPLRFLGTAGDQKRPHRAVARHHVDGAALALFKVVAVYGVVHVQPGQPRCVETPTEVFSEARVPSKISRAVDPGIVLASPQNIPLRDIAPVRSQAVACDAGRAQLRQRGGVQVGHDAVADDVPRNNRALRAPELEHRCGNLGLVIVPPLQLQWSVATSPKNRSPVVCASAEPHLRGRWDTYTFFN